MASVRVLLRKNKIKKDGRIPIYIRIVKNRKAKFVSIGISITEDQWNESSSRVRRHKNATRINHFIAHKIAEVEGVVLDMEAKNKFVSPLSIKNKVMGTNSTSLTQYFKDYLELLLSTEKIGSYRKCKSVFNKFNEYANNKDIQFIQIDYAFLLRYEKYLRVELGNGVNTIHTNLKVFRKLFNDAVREDLIAFDQNPFTKYKLKQEKPHKEYLSEDEIESIENLELVEGSMMNHHRNMYIFACYAGGIRISDLLQMKWSSYNGSHVTITTQKTKSVVSIKLPKKALSILSYYKDRITDGAEAYIFPFLDYKIDYSPMELNRVISNTTAYTNKDLVVIAKKAGITKHISFHTSRHTWATRALRKGMRIEYVSKLMGHASIKTTQIYSKIVNSELDKAMDVFD